MERTYTFGADHVNPRTGKPLRRFYVVIEGATYEHCRAIMFNHFGRNWAMEYENPEAAGKSKFNLTKLHKDEWPFPNNDYQVDEYTGTCVYVD